MLYDLTSTYFEGLAEDNELARRGYSRDHRGDCKQVVLALVVTRDGFPLAHRTLAGNTQDLQTVETIVTEVEQRFGKTKRVWVMDRGMISKESLAFLKQPGRRYLLATRRGELTSFQSELHSGGWQRLPENPEVQVKLICREARALPAGPESPAAQEGASDSPSPATWPGSRPATPRAAHRHGPPEEPRQDPGARGSAEGPLSQGPPVRDDHRQQGKAG